MLESKKISFLSAVLININIVIGGAFFLGAPDVSLKAGFAAPLVWMLCAFLLTPLVFIFSKFAFKYPQAGGIYVYSEKELGRFWGYLGAWLYFVATSAGNAMVLRSFAYYLYAYASIGETLSRFGISPLTMELGLVLFFAWLSLSNVQLLEYSQLFFTLLKIIPFLVITIGAIALFSPTQLLEASTFTPSSLLSSIPTVLFAFIGIEACSAIIDKVDNAKKHGFKVIVTSFIAITLVYALAQFFIVSMFGQSPVNSFLAVMPHLLGDTVIASWCNNVIYLAILCSFLGGFYGMFYVNSWNLFAMAEQQSVFGSSFWLSLNKQQAPWACIGLQTCMLAGMLALAKTSNLLIAMGDLGVLFAYFLTALAYVRACPSFLGYAGVASATVLAGLLIQDVHSIGWLVTLPFWMMFFFGLIIYRPKIAS